MPISIAWTTKIISVPKTYLTNKGGGIYELDINQFRLDLRGLEDDEQGIPFLPTHQHNTEVVLSGATYSRMFIIINGYTITFEDGQYAINAKGANSNVADVMNVNQVSLRSFNAAGLITVTSGSGITEQDKDDIVDKTWDEDISVHNLNKSASIALRGTSYTVGNITFDSVNGVSGTGYPIGTTYTPSNNLTDTLLIMTYGKVDDLVLRSDLTVEAIHDISNLLIRTIGLMGTDVILMAGCNANQTSFRNVNLSGEISNGNQLLIYDCSIGNFINFNGIMHNVAFSQGAEITLDSWATIIQGTCGGDPTNEVEINIGTASLNMTHWTGNLKLTGKTGANRTVINCDSGNIIIDSTCVAGIIQILGNGTIESDNSGAGCTVDVDGFSSVENIVNSVWETLTSEHITIGTYGYEIIEKLKELREVNISYNFVKAIEQNLTRNVDVGVHDYMEIKIRKDGDPNWDTPVDTDKLYFWYENLGDTNPIYVGEEI